MNIICAESSPSASRPSLDFDYILDEQNRESIRENIKYRKQVGDIDAVHDHWSRIHSVMTGECKERLRDDAAHTHCSAAAPRPATDGDWQRMWDELYAAAADLPNMSDERAPRTNEPLVVDMHGWRCALLCTQLFVFRYASKIIGSNTQSGESWPEVVLVARIGQGAH
jgi:hypothetical protein